MERHGQHPEWKEAITFYKTMLDESGQADPVSYSFNECLTALKEGKAAMWADAPWPPRCSRPTIPR